MSDQPQQSQQPQQGGERRGRAAFGKEQGGDRRGGRREGGGERREGGDRRDGGRPGARRPRRDAKDAGDTQWIPVTKLGRLVKEKKIKSLEEIYLHSLPIKESQIIDFFLKAKLKDEVIKISPVQKQTTAGQRTRFKAYVVIGDFDGHCGLGISCASEVATSIRNAITLAKLSIVPVRRGYWGNKIGEPHTVPTKVTGKCGSVSVRLTPAPSGSGIVAAPVPKKLLNMAGYIDVFTASTGHTKTLGNFVKATFDAISKTYGFLTPDLWGATEFKKSPYQEHTTFLQHSAKKSYGKSA
jgi:small subunit ribosomal protein S2e